MNEQQYTEADIMADLIARTEGKRQRATARELNMSESFINDVIRGRRKLTANLIAALGYRPLTILYVKEQKP